MVFVVIFVYLAVSFVLQEFTVLGLVEQVRSLERQASELEAANAELKEEIQYARTDAYIEQVAREELGLVWPNEIPYAPGGAPSAGSAGSGP